MSASLFRTLLLEKIEEKADFILESFLRVLLGVAGASGWGRRRRRLREEERERWMIRTREGLLREL